MAIPPEHYQRFPCSEYFESYRDGRYDDEAQLWLLLPSDQIHVDAASDGLIIGRPGVDGIQFCYREGLEGIWAFYPIDADWVRIAPTLRDLESGWKNGTIFV
jgi:hypothetical protein